MKRVGYLLSRSHSSCCVLLLDALRALGFVVDYFFDFGLVEPVDDGVFAFGNVDLIHYEVFNEIFG